MRIGDWSSDVCSSDLLELRATERTWMASVSWNYPQDRLIALRGTNAAAAAASPVANGVDVARLNFRYRIEGDNAPWRPVRAFDDSAQVFIEFPAGIGQGEIPPLFVIGPNGGGERSEEHTSELKSLMRIPYAVFCLKKKRKND